jgi:hypothetical protein
VKKMTHELRTPLNSIIGFTGIVLQGMAGSLNPEQAKQLGMVRGSARHLLDLINDVLRIGKTSTVWSPTPRAEGAFAHAHRRDSRRGEDPGELPMERLCATNGPRDGPAPGPGEAVTLSVRQVVRGGGAGQASLSPRAIRRRTRLFQ